MKNLLLFFLSGLMFAGCSSESDSDLMEKAKKSVENKNISDAIAAYNKVSAEFPESDNAPEALYQLASLYQSKMVDNMTEYESMDKAASKYKQVYQEYPDSKRAPVSLFMSAFIQANELKKYEEATRSYKLFLEKFPDHELASSAKDEIEHMGKSPNDILKYNEKRNI